MSNTSMRGLKETMARFIRERDWEQFHTPKNLSMSVAIEAAELMELFQWMTPEEAQASLSDRAFQEKVREEAADVLAYLLSLSIALDFDLGEAFLAKLVKNSEKYPAGEFAGRWKRAT